MSKTITIPTTAKVETAMAKTETVKTETKTELLDSTKIGGVTLSRENEELEKKAGQRMKAASEAAQAGQDKTSMTVTNCCHEVKTYTVAEWVSQREKGSVLIPRCQRLFIWNKKQIDLLMDSIKRGISIGGITVCEWQGKFYLVDGLQRTTSVMQLSVSDDLTDEEKETLANFKLSVDINYNIPPKAMPAFFLRLNAGTKVATSVKERAKLADDIQSKILSLTDNEFWKDIAEECSASFAKNQQYEIVCDNIILALVGAPIGSITAAALGSRLKDYSKIIREHEKMISENGNKVINTIKEISDKLGEKAIKKVFTSNFLAVMAFIIAEEMKNGEAKFCVGDYVKLCEETFPDNEKKSAEWYSESCGSGSASTDKVQARYEKMKSILSEYKTEIIIDEKKDEKKDEVKDEKKK